jgi:2-oxoglutarate dehydrogenase complex dehydrogenase (E1) component-like enzyme
MLTTQAAASSLESMMPGTSFQPVLDTDPNHSATRVILCSGKHYYTLLDHFAKVIATDVSLVRVEELSPFPRRQLKEVLAKYTKAEKVVWAQEEPENQGAWSFVQSRIDGVLRDLDIGSGRTIYAGRKSCPTVAVAVGAWHKKEVEEIAALPLEV